MEWDYRGCIRFLLGGQRTKVSIRYQIVEQCYVTALYTTHHRSKCVDVEATTQFVNVPLNLS